MDPKLASDVTLDLALKEGVCIRPVLHQVTDVQTGHTITVVMACRATRESRCPSCAAAARRVRMQQCAEGWHLEEEPDLDTRAAESAEDDELADDDPADAGDEEEASRRTRSTRRRSDSPDLPVRPAERRTIGQVYEGNLGRRYRPSMFVTLTLPSYGAIVQGRGVPVNPDEYDYRTAALDAMHFTKLLDRWVLSLRRCAGYKVQYFGAIEAQRRLAPHFHVALRGAIPRQVIRQVTRATYTQIWWPTFDQPVYCDGDEFPEWDGIDYLDPATKWPLRTWDDALRELDDDLDAKPAHTLGFGRQLDIQGLLGGTPDADRSVRYLTKSIADTYTQDDVYDSTYDAHISRLHDQVKILPCSPTCSNWLRYGIQPKDAGPGLVPGTCSSNAHSWEDLGVGGRRVQVSRGWSNKTLAEHRADRSAVVRKVLEEAGYEPSDVDRMSTQALTDTGEPRYRWSAVTLPPEKATGAILDSILERRRWRAQYERAKTILNGTGPPVDSNSATDPDDEEEGEHHVRC
ncbi:MAG: replication initiation protein [Intrasporangium sp.]|uniref:replication initiator n=1 Tax=Intrasporangium sp. TaxID=1925024 RepID=UPI00264999E8|nr:replication initiator [Intrasporangium sp.]MDN5795881.1 replication initiation protein [Intrasporangium sp.]